MSNKRKLLTGLSSLLLAATLAACAVSGDNNDPYEDPDRAAPAPIENPTVTPAFSVGTPDSTGLISLNVSGLALEAVGGLSAQAVTNLKAGDFTVVEAGKVKGITVEPISSDARAGADIIFVLDTTASMGPGLTSAGDSLADFADHLDASGLDVRVGAIAFGDAYDTLDPDDVDSNTLGHSFMNETPPGFDSDERPSFPLSADFEAFKDFVSHEARDGGRSGGDIPENSLGALEYTYDTDAFGWRDGAQRIMIVITDACAHTDQTYMSANITAPWIPKSAAAVIDKLQGSATVHVISPESLSCGTNYANMKDVTGVTGTGGVFVDWNGYDDFDLKDLPITAAVAGGYLVKYRGTIDGSPKDVRLVIDNGSDIRGETTRVSTY